MAIIGCDQGDRTFPGKFNNLPVDNFLFRNRVFLEFKKEAPVCKQVTIKLNLSSGPFVILASQWSGDHSAETGAQRDQALMMFSQQLFINSRLIVETFQVSFGYQLAEIFIAGLIHGQQHQMMGVIRFFIVPFITA